MVMNIWKVLRASPFLIALSQSEISGNLKFDKKYETYRILINKYPFLTFFSPLLSSIFFFFFLWKGNLISGKLEMQKDSFWENIFLWNENSRLGIRWKESHESQQRKQILLSFFARFRFCGQTWKSFPKGTRYTYRKNVESDRS